VEAENAGIRDSTEDEMRDNVSTHLRNPKWLVCLLVPSRPGEFHPEPLTDSGLDTLSSSGSCHRTTAAAVR